MENPPQRWTTENLVAAYVQYHQRTRGIADHSLRAYSRYVHEILTGSFGQGHH